MISIHEFKNVKQFEEAIEKEFKKKIFPISKKQVVGGQEGGSCWNADHHHSVSAEPEPEDPMVFIELLEMVCPNLTFLQFKKLEQKSLWDISEKTDHGYYGNSTDYMIKKLNTQNLFDGLKEIIAE